MKNAMYTPGQWGYSRGAVWLMDEPGHVICNVLSGPCKSLGEAYANGDLIAAAPDLMMALERLLSFYVIDGEFSAVPCMGPKDAEIEAAWGAAQSAIAKATGGGS